MAESEWIDISVPLRPGMVYFPADPMPPRIERIMDVERGDGVTITELDLISHSGTHIDSPFHFIHGAMTIDKMPLDTTIGLARVIEIKDEKSITQEELEPYNIKPGERILFKSRNSP